MKDQRLEDIPLIPAEEITDEQLAFEELFNKEDLDPGDYDLWVDGNKLDYNLQMVKQTIHI